jgi:Fe-S cluster biogenesis protein NfuA
MSIRNKVEEALDEIRPYLQNDGGDITLVSVENDIAKVEFTGYCASCSKSLMTLNGVAAVIKKYAPEIKEVIE